MCACFNGSRREAKIREMREQVEKARREREAQARKERASG